jgi:hypothetical protein
LVLELKKATKKQAMNKQVSENSLSLSWQGDTGKQVFDDVTSFWGCWAKEKVSLGQAIIETTVEEGGHPI